MTTEDRSAWTGEQWTQYASRLASEGVEPAVKLLINAVKGDAPRNLQSRMMAAESILKLAGLLKQSAPAQPVTSGDLVEMSEWLRQEKQKERRGT